MGDCQNEDLRLGFDSRLKLKFLGSQITTDAGLLAYRELDEALGLTETSVVVLTDSRLGSNKQHQLVPLFRQSIYSRLAGYEDVNDAERLCVDPAMRHVVGGRATLPEKQAASASEVGRFETETLSTKSNLTALMGLSGQWIDQVHRRQPLKQLILDLDSSVSETYGRQQGTAYNGHFECLCYHPLFLFNQFGDLESVMLRRGNNASAKYWRRVLVPVIERYRHLSIPKFFRGDAAFANPALYRLLEKKGYLYAIRLKANAVLEREIEHLLTRPVGRPSHMPKVFYHSFQYQAKSWQQARRVVAKVEWHQGELFPRVGFIVTNLSLRSKRVVRFYNGRGTAEEYPAHYVERLNLYQRSRSSYSVRRGVVETGLLVAAMPAAASRKHRRCVMSLDREDFVPPARTNAESPFSPESALESVAGVGTARDVADAGSDAGSASRAVLGTEGGAA